MAIAGAVGIACSPNWTPVIWLIGLMAGVVLCFFKKLRPLALLLIAACGFGGYAQAYTSANLSTSDIHKLLAREKHDLKTTAFECEGVVVSMPVEKLSLSGKRRTEFELRLTRLATLQPPTRHTIQDKVIVRFTKPPTPPISYTDRIRFQAKLALPFRAENDGQFDYSQWLSKKGIHYVAYAQAESVEILAKRQGHVGQWLASHAREQMLEIMQLPFFFKAPEFIRLMGWSIPLQTNEQVAALMSGMFLGYSSQMDDELEQAFRDTGTLHLFAISGQNVAAIAAILIWTLEMAGVVRWRWGWLLIPFIFIFCLSAGMSAGAARTFIMVSLTYIGWKLYRPVDPLNILGTTALLAWALNPNQLFDIGFQLSYGIVIALLLFTAPLTRFFYKLWPLDPWIPKRLVPKRRMQMDALYKLFCAAWSVSIIAWLGSLPLVFFHFHQCTPIAPLANVCIAPLATLIVLGCTLSVCLGWVWHGFSIMLNQAIWVLIQMIAAIVLILSKVPGGHFHVGLQPMLHPVSERVVILTAGAASPMILSVDDARWLVDTGSISQSRGVVSAAQRHWGINTWDGVILSQLSLRHTGGALELARWNHVKRWVESGFRPYSASYAHWPEWTCQHHVGREFWRDGDRLMLSKRLRADVLWPPGSATPREQAGMLLRFHLDSLDGKPPRTILWARAVPPYVCKEVIENHIPVRADILIQTSERGLPPAWLEAVQPIYWVHPATPGKLIRPATYKLTQKLEIKLIELEKTGSATFTIKEGKWRLQTFFNRGNTDEKSEN